jgi:hypothetical protein
VNRTACVMEHVLGAALTVSVAPGLTNVHNAQSGRRPGFAPRRPA